MTVEAGQRTVIAMLEPQVKTYPGLIQAELTPTE